MKNIILVIAFMLFASTSMAGTTYSLQCYATGGSAMDVGGDTDLSLTIPVQNPSILTAYYRYSSGSESSDKIFDLHLELAASDGDGSTYVQNPGEGDYRVWLSPAITPEVLANARKGQTFEGQVKDAVGYVYTCTML